MDDSNTAPPSIETTHPHLKEFRAFLDEFNKETERGAVLVASSLIDDLLGRTISSFVVDVKESSRLLEGFNAPLGTFAAKSLAAYALGLISRQEYEECEIVRKIRNAFAHGVHVSFDKATVKDMCAKLTLAAKSYGEVTVSPRGHFSTAAIALILNLTNRPHYVSLKRQRFEPWPY